MKGVHDIKVMVRAAQGCAEGTLECGSASYRLVLTEAKAAARLPQSKAVPAAGPQEKTVSPPIPLPRHC